MNDTSSKQKLLSFLEQELQLPVGANFRFFDDTGIDGIDAWNLMRDFGVLFDVDMTDFDPEKYFTQEQNLMNLPKRVLNRIRTGKMRSFNIDHLLETIVRGAWFDPQ